MEKPTSAVRETRVSRHNGGSIMGPSKTPQYDSADLVRGISGEPSIGSL